MRAREVQPPPAANAPLDRLAARARTGSREAFDALVEALGEPIYQFLRLRSGGREDPEALTQDVFLRAWNRIASYDPSRPFVPWLYSVAARHSASVLRRRRPLSVDASHLDHLGGGENPAEQVARDDQRNHLWSLAMRLLTRDQRSALWLRYGEDLSTAQIATALERSETAVRQLLHRARRTLGAALADAPGAAPSPRPTGALRARTFHRTP